MIKRWLFPVLAVGALCWAFFYVFFLGNKQLPPAQPLVEPTAPQFQNYISASGIIEAATENIAIGTNLPGIVTKIYVQEGDKVAEGAPLFTIDDRAAQAELSAAEARASAAAAQVAEVEAKLAEAQSQLSKFQSVTDARAVSRSDVDSQRFAVQSLTAQLGSLRANAKSARAEAHAASVNLDRLTVTAPVAGEVLKLNLRAGEYAAAGTGANNPLMLLGDTETLHIRADIDENDAWRFRAGGKAHASLRGNPEMKVDLNFVRVQPYVVPKKSLTGDSAERVDTRVLQVLYSFPRDAMNAYVGQLVDVFIDAENVQ